MWEPHKGAWCLIEKGKNGHFYFLKALEGRPTLKNTVQFLGRMRKMWYGIDDFAEDLDRPEKEKARDLQRKVDDASNEVAQAAWHAHPDNIRVGYTPGGPWTR